MAHLLFFFLIFFYLATAEFALPQASEPCYPCPPTKLTKMYWHAQASPWCKLNYCIQKSFSNCYSITLLPCYRVTWVSLMYLYRPLSYHRETLVTHWKYHWILKIISEGRVLLRCEGACVIQQVFRVTGRGGSISDGVSTQKADWQGSQSTESSRKTSGLFCVRLYHWSSTKTSTQESRRGTGGIAKMMVGCLVR